MNHLRNVVVVVVVVAVPRDRWDRWDLADRQEKPVRQGRRVYRGVLDSRALLALWVLLGPGAFEGAWNVTGGNVFGSIRTSKLTRAYP